MRAKRGRLRSDVCIDIKHTTIVVTEDAQAVLAHTLHHMGRIHPVGQFLPHRLVLKVACHDIVSYTRAVEQTGQFWYGACLTVSQPLTRHPSSISHTVNLLVVDSRYRLYVQQQEGFPYLLGNR